MAVQVSNVPSRAQPLPAAWSVRAGRDAYLTENGFTLESYDAPSTQGVLLGIAFHVPNTPRHRWAIMRHDLHHVATGYGTDLAGEAEISAWELRGGLRSLGLFTGAIVTGAALLGLLIAPLRTWRAFQAGHAGRSLFVQDGLPYEALLELEVGELRRQLGLPERGLSTRARASHALVPG
jgi:hypothetical protein